MKNMRRFATTKPVLFGLLMIVVWSLLVTLGYPLHFLFPDTEVGRTLGDAAARAAAFIALSLLIWALGWLRRSGLGRWGSHLLWWLAAIPGTYLTLAELFAFTGNVFWPRSSSPMAVPELLNTLAGAALEEALFRGLILTAMVLAWGDTHRGIAKAVVVSSLLFGATHLTNVLIRPVGVVILQALLVSLPGIFYGALLLRGGSLWPGVVIHWISNAAINVALIGNAAYEETPTMWLWFALFVVPLAAAGLVSLRTAPVLTKDEASADAGTVAPDVMLAQKS
ncbi:MAG: CPBP family intramembrane metalloprotease [Anaerolineae bacterium]|nr:CPBP family intramembrane metalloprotease [Anaerolineae bacterium]